MKVWAAFILVVGLLPAGRAAAQDPEATRVPFQTSLTFNIAYGNSATAFVPDGQRLVIMMVSASCSSTSSTQLVSSFRVQASAKDPTTGVMAATVHFFPTVSQGPTSGNAPNYQWLASSPTHIYAEGGTKVAVSAQASTADPVSCWATIAGFLVKPLPLD